MLLECATSGSAACPQYLQHALCTDVLRRISSPSLIKIARPRGTPAPTSRYEPKKKKIRKEHYASLFLVAFDLNRRRENVHPLLLDHQRRWIRRGMVLCIIKEWGFLPREQLGRNLITYLQATLDAVWNYESYIYNW